MQQQGEEGTIRALAGHMEDTACQRTDHKVPVGGMVPSSSRIHSAMEVPRSSVVAAVRPVCVGGQADPLGP